MHKSKRHERMKQQQEREIKILILLSLLKRTEKKTGQILWRLGFCLRIKQVCPPGWLAV